MPATGSRYDRRVLAVFVLVFVVVPLVEIYVAVQVGARDRRARTRSGCCCCSRSSGAWLTKHAGLVGDLAASGDQLDAGTVPTNELIDGGLVLAGGVLLIVPGFVTDAFGLLLLFPPTAGRARGTVKRRFQGRVTYLGGRPGHGPLDGPGDIIDV